MVRVGTSKGIGTYIDKLPGWPILMPNLNMKNMYTNLSLVPGALFHGWGQHGCAVPVGT